MPLCARFYEPPQNGISATGQPFLGCRPIMADPVTLSEEYVYQIAPDGKSAQSAQELVRRGAFQAAKLSADGTRLDARCQGSEKTPYKVGVDLSDPDRPRTGCDCGSFKRPCKHALGLILLAVRSPEAFERAGAPAAPQKKGRGRRPADLEDVAVRKAEVKEQKVPADVGEALLQAILAEPEDEAARLVYADWLDENGGPAEQARAEFIRVQCELARLPEGDPRGKELRAREKALWTANRDPWQQDIPEELRRKNVQFRRGFLEEVHLPPKVWARHGEGLFGRHPIHRVRLERTLNRKDAAAVAVNPYLARVRVLALVRCEFREPLQTLRILFATPFLSGLRRLEVRKSYFGSRELGVLAEGPLLGRLRELILEGNTLSPKAGQALGETDKVANLTELSLANNLLGDAGARALAASPHLGALRHLDLRGVRLGEGAKAALRERFGERVLLD
jgi:uncharacterized protein (TIGR02996 family)